MILACPGCDSRYDVTGHALGQRFRCRCGEMMTLSAPPPSAGELGCPRCGAGVPATASACAYCGAELLMKACPRCLSRVFHGHKHCPDCGAALSVAASAAPYGDRPCPRCASALSARRVGDIVIDECGGCRGVFLDHVAIQRVVVDRAQARAEALLGALPRSEISAAPPAGQKMYLRCPLCSAVMNRKQFATGAGVIIDVCRAHGTFFDAGELPLIIDFVMNGGLDRAQKKDLARLQEAVRRERELAREAAAAPGARWAYEPDRGRGATGALVDLLNALLG
jgi:Zn-finger nucleic acid-binding protein